MPDKSDRVLLVGGDLMARARLHDAATRGGVDLTTTSPGSIGDALRKQRADVLILDLDGGREPVLKELVRAREEGLAPKRVVGYYSHVDRALGEAAKQAGCDARPRGEFWRILDEVLNRE